MNEVAFLRMMVMNRKITSKPKTAVSHGRYPNMRRDNNFNGIIFSGITLAFVTL